MTLNELLVGASARIEKVGGQGALRQHFLDMGVIPGVIVTVRKLAPLGDPMELTLHGYELTLRLEEASQIEITPVSQKEPEPDRKRRKKSYHPALGEESPGLRKANPNLQSGKKGSSHPLPADHIYTFALVGNQNSGKTTLFNQLTGSNQHVGNFPGVTVDRKDGAILSQPNTRITDLPGIYSMSPYSSEELVSRNFVLNEKPDGIINIVDVTNIERNLYLTMQLLEMNTPMVVALNMMDEMTENGGQVDINMMEQLLGVPVVPIAAAKKQGIQELVRHAMHVARHQEKPIRQDFCSADENGGAVHRCLHATAHLIEDHCEKGGIPVRFAASKIIEGDQMILEQLELDGNEKETLEHISVQMEQERGLDRSEAIADMRFAFIERVCAECVVRPRESLQSIRSEKIDKVLTGKWTAIPIFIAIMAAVFYLTFNVIGAYLQGLLESGVDWVTVTVDQALTAGQVNAALHSLIIDGIFAGVGSVLSFLPIVVVMFFFLSMMEDSGYIARVAFFMDKLLRRIGLSGRSIVPMLIGFGCSVPAVMSTRTLPSERDRKMTILLTPFMSCTAKLPIYAFFVSAFFPGKGGLIMIGLYLLGIVMGILMARIFRRTLFKGEPVPFVMELPTYRLPTPRSTLQLMWEKAKDFLQKAFSVILIATVIVWFLVHFDMHFSYVEDSAAGIMSTVSNFLAPLFAPLGFGNWKIVTALITGFMAKESVVATMQVLFGSRGGIQEILTPLAAGSLLIFSLLYTPCVATIASIKRELGSGWALAVSVWQCVLAWLVAFLFYTLAGIFF